MATNHSPLTYTQETLFEQAIGGPIAALWQTRQEGFVKGTEKKKIYWCKLTNPEHKKAVLIVNGRIESSWKYQELFYDLYRQGTMCIPLTTEDKVYQIAYYLTLIWVTSMTLLTILMIWTW